MLPQFGPLRPWTDPCVVGVHRLPLHVPLNGLDRRSLDGRWRLEMFESPDRVPVSALTGDDRQSSEVSVPGNWTMQDLGAFHDPPHYTNIQMPFEGPPPSLPERNPTGVYRKRFRIPAAWRSGRTILHVGGAESVHLVYLNGKAVGYGTDSRLPSEYDLTDALVGGWNELAIVVVKYSAQSYLEDQDQWWMGGLHRSVWIESRPMTCLADLPITTDYDPEAETGTIEVTAAVDFGGPTEPGWSIKVTTRDPTGRKIGSSLTAPVDAQHRIPYLFTGFAASVRQFLVNGQPVWIFGVNRHDHHPDRGKAVTRDDQLDDLIAMRQHNITAIRTAHYPNDESFYDQCDELGFYVVAEANIEAHAYNRSLCHDGRYRSAWLERGSRMVQWLRNHPAIIQWSLGNESGYGANVDALAAWIRHADPTRPLHYEDGIRDHGWVDGARMSTDIVCPMYSTIDEIVAYGQSGEGDRPLIMCEYSHAMGNSNGSLADYWDAFDSTPGLQGGFVWEWKDHGLRQIEPDGSSRLAYGGQFGDTPHDGNFVADGIMSAELVPHPGARELAWVYRPVALHDRGDGEVEIANRQSFSDLSWLTARCELLDRTGEVVRTWRWRPPSLKGRESAVVSISDLVGAELPADGWLTIRWLTRRDTWYASAGHLVAWDQVVIGDPNGSVAMADGMPVPIAPELMIWRAPVDNDGFKLMPELAEALGVGGQVLAGWQAAQILDRPADSLVDHDYLIDDESVHRHSVMIPSELAEVGRVGVRFSLPAKWTSMRWFGRGPHENYPDRCCSALMGIWERDLDDLPYLVPQEFGLRTECRWLELLGADSDEVIRIEAVDNSLHMSVTRYRDEDLLAAAHQSDLESRDELIVHLDVAHRGVGTASCGPDVGDQYRIEPGRYSFGYRVISIRDDSSTG
ncbi:MAG: beta-galatosidase [Ilumatobacter coccineus]|uniref:beta-galactosidase n=1 Tax=Ilumatobacter coccineus TaxID=467094 RepID=A0A2G6K8Q4_9ACTN|nr:MAG: beta-galatosidase [Ilumatobacter coccineus]